MEFGACHLRPLLNVLRHDAHGDFRHALRTDFDSNGTCDARDFFGGGDFFVHKMFANRPRFSRAADHAEELKRAMYPCLQHERIVLVTARDDEAECGRGGEGRVELVLPMTDMKGNFARENVVVREFGAVVKNADGEIELQRERRDGLGDVA